MCYGKVCRVLGGVLLLVVVLVDTRAAEKQWSSWYNSDSPDFGPGDNETVERISLIFGLPCSPQDISSVQCRRRRKNPASKEEEEGVFQLQSVYGGNVLHVPCNASGLLCRHEDQTLESSSSSSFLTACIDYEIRLMCYGGGNSNQSDTPAGNDITSHGAFIGVVAGGSVILPLVFVLILRFRKSKQAQRQRDQDAQQSVQSSDMEEGEDGGSADPPPPYHLLFASPGPESGVTSEESSGESVVSPSRSSADWLVDSHVTGGDHMEQGFADRGGRLEETSASSAPAMPADVVVSAAEFSERSVARNSSRGLSSASPASRTATIAATLATASSDVPLRRVSSGSSSASSTSSTRTLLTPVSAANDVIHNDPPPAYDWPRGGAVPSHVIAVAPAVSCDDTSGRTFSVASPSADSAMNDCAPCALDLPPTVHHPPPRVCRTPQRRFLGMHLSVVDLMSAVYPETDHTPSPPPTYDDALKILEAPSEQREVLVT